MNVEELYMKKGEDQSIDDIIVRMADQTKGQPNIDAESRSPHANFPTQENKGTNIVPPNNSFILLKK